MPATMPATMKGRLYVKADDKPRGARTTFHAVPIGTRFFEQIFSFSGINAGRIGYHVFEKTTKSKAVCVEQHGYGNSRAEGGTFCFSPYSTIFVVE